MFYFQIKTFEQLTLGKRGWIVSSLFNSCEKKLKMSSNSNTIFSIYRQLLLGVFSFSSDCFVLLTKTYVWLILRRSPFIIYQTYIKEIYLISALVYSGSKSKRSTIMQQWKKNPIRSYFVQMFRYVVPEINKWKGV